MATVAVFTDTVVYSMVVPILPRSADSLGATSAAIGFLFASYAIALLVTLPVFGIVSDRIGRRCPMLWGRLRSTLGIAAVPLAAYAVILLAMPRPHAAVAQR